jgi:hypothetical protein
MRLTVPRPLIATVLGLSVMAAPAMASPVRHAAASPPDALRIALARRTDRVEARLTAARAAGRVSVAGAATMRERIGWVRVDSAKLSKRQGFLSAGESASYHRALDDIERRLG